ncbi:hypothetical protein HB980_00480 [Yersinia massiliensis]|uniref:Small integral membrane protein 15 n=1 Tax=Yersinia massiliensis TaxID=419257 RepID=A0AA90XVP0_9GAMM|nr:hypothetical protein [Yersinia massiliensis]NIL25038.1 hypothetical protein [Yersinia massiliensis]
MELGWLPEALQQVRLLWESVYDKSPPLAYFVILAIFTFPFYALHTWSKFSKQEKAINDRVKEARKKSKNKYQRLKGGEDQ